MSNPERTMVFLSGQQKIAAHHLQRLSYVYIRQSSREQVLRNRGSQANQYQLIQRAEVLGWQAERVRVIDADMGLSGRDSTARTGFKELLAEIALGHVGIVFGYEVSRLARNNSDWYHLLDLAAVFHTLIADYDGIYDPRLYNDRLLLGLKGTMSEAELHLLKLRLDAGRMRKIERGDYRQLLPTGLVRLPNGEVVKDPDDQLRHTIELVFEKLTELGSCRKVLLYLRDAQIQLPRKQTHGPRLGEVVWKQASHAAVYAFLTNPAYAGAFAYGRVQLDPARRQPGRKDTGFVHKPMEEWIHLQQDVYPAYITWEQYLANRERLRQNALRFQAQIQRAQGAVRKGVALLQGLATCGVCGCRMQVTYKPTHRYMCSELKHRIGAPMCASMYGPAIDEVVVEAFFTAIQPAQLDALEAVLAKQRAEQALLDQQWEERLKRARYAAQLAERQYNVVDPDNRLVAAELERRWEEQLRQLQEAQEAYARFQRKQLPLNIPTGLREQFRHISETLPELWRSRELTFDQKKELLRSLIGRVILKRAVRNTIEVKIVWVSGHYSIVYAHPPIYRLRDADDYDEMVQRIHELWKQGLADEQIAERLTDEGFRAARAKKVGSLTVQRIRLEHGWKRTDYHYSRSLDTEGYLTVTQLATLLSVERNRILRRIRNHKIDSDYVIHHPKYTRAYLVQDDPELIKQLRQELTTRKRVNGGI